MTDLIIHEPLAGRLRQLAERENISPEALIEQMVWSYEANGALVQPDRILPYPHGPTPEQLRQMPFEEAEKHIRRKIYRIARRYWHDHGEIGKLALTDEYLDEHFWLIDHEGIPRFNWEKDKVKLPPDPMDALIGLFDDAELTGIDLSMTTMDYLSEMDQARDNRPD